MSGKVKPRLAVTAEGIFRRTENIVVPGEDRDSDSCNRDHLGRDVQQGENRKKLFVASEAAGVNTDGVVDGADPSQHRHAEPPGSGIRYAAQRQRQPGHSNDCNQDKKRSAKRDVL